jgi:hypothetical protein
MTSGGKLRIDAGNMKLGVTVALVPESVQNIKIVVLSVIKFHVTTWRVCEFRVLNDTVAST